MAALTGPSASHDFVEPVLRPPAAHESFGPADRPFVARGFFLRAAEPVAMQGASVAAQLESKAAPAAGVPRGSAAEAFSAGMLPPSRRASPAAPQGEGSEPFLGRAACRDWRPGLAVFSRMAPAGGGGAPWPPPAGVPTRGGGLLALATTGRLTTGGGGLEGEADAAAFVLLPPRTLALTGAIGAARTIGAAATTLAETLTVARATGAAETKTALGTAMTAPATRWFA